MNRFFRILFAIIITPLILICGIIGATISAIFIFIYTLLEIIVFIYKFIIGKKDNNIIKEIDRAKED